MKQQSCDVFISDTPLTIVDSETVEFLKRQLPHSTKGRVRLCAHQSTNDSLQQMIIVLAKGGYVRPHKHLKSVESFHIIEGTLTVVIFDDLGKVTRKIELGDTQSTKPFFYRLPAGTFHTVLIQSDVAVVHEIIEGPFDRSLTQFADWSPNEDELDKVKNFVGQLE